jgi:hypothetical protein
VLPPPKARGYRAVRARSPVSAPRADSNASFKRKVESNLSVPELELVVPRADGAQGAHTAFDQMLTFKILLRLAQRPRYS